jgi:hypothetical protein
MHIVIKVIASLLAFFAGTRLGLWLYETSSPTPESSRKTAEKRYESMRGKP